MLLRLLILFTVVPMVELWLLVQIGEQIGFLLTIVLILGTGAAGAWLARWQGLMCVQTVQRQLQSGRLPTDSLLDGMGILVAAALLVTPGVLTDIVGLGLLIPPVRRLARRAGGRMIRARFETITLKTPGQSTDDDAGNNGHDRIIDVRVIDEDEDTK